MRKLEARQCQALRVDGLRCRAYAIEGSDFCTVHSMTPEEHRAMSVKGAQGRGRTLREREAAASDDRPKMERDVYMGVERVHRELLHAKIPGSQETDFRLASVGALLSWLMCDPPEETFEGYAHRVLPRDVAHRASEAERVAREELDESLRGLGFRPIDEWLALRESPRDELMHALVADGPSA